MIHSVRLMADFIHTPNKKNEGQDFNWDIYYIQLEFYE